MIQDALDFASGVTNKVINTMNDLFAFLADLSDPLPENAEDTNLAATWKKQVELKLQILLDLQRHLTRSMLPPYLKPD